MHVKGTSDINIFFNTHKTNATRLHKRELKLFVVRGDISMRDQVVEWFRPLIGAQKWDYVVVWKLGDDPSRFIEWLSCCCGGGYDDCGNAKEKKGENSHLTSPCKDTYLKHPVRTKACEALAQLPSSMPLYSGVHTDVVISRQPRWLSQVDSSESNHLHKFSGTRLLIPIEDVLIELCAAKHIPEDLKVLELILAHCNILLQQENISTLRQSCIQKQPSSLNLLNLSPRSEVFQQVSRSGSRSSTGGPSATSRSNHFNEHLWFSTGSNCVNKSQLEPSNFSYEKSSGSIKLDYKEEFLTQQACLVSGCEVEKTTRKVTKGKDKGNYKSVNLMAERNRRQRIKTAHLRLRSLVPNITKMDTASILGDAVTYIRQLQKEEKELQEELKRMEEAIPESDKAKGVNSYLPPAENLPGFTTLGPKMKTELIQVEVKQIGERECFIKIFGEHKKGGFLTLMEAIDSLELQVVSANLTTFNGRVQNILEVKADKGIQAMKLRNLLIELTG